MARTLAKRMNNQAKRIAAANRGFTTAAALLIGVHQLPALLGIAVERTARLHVLLGELWLHLPSLHMPTAMLGLSSFGLMWALKKWAPQWPSALLLLAAR